MTGGAELSARERKRGHECGWAGLLGHARLLGRAARASARAWTWARERGQAARRGRARERGRGRESAGRPRGWAEPERGGGVGPRWILFFFFKNVNSNSICLFH
jgi:hypothetical protein